MSVPTPRFTVELSSRQITALDDFKKVEKLGSQVEALNLLLEIAFDTITSDGKRF